jgi:rod shape-determining protein MreC
MQTSREDFGIVVRSAFLSKGTKQRFSLTIFILISILFIFFETFDFKPLSFVRPVIKDTIYRGSLIVSTPAKFTNSFKNSFVKHIQLYSNYDKLKEENNQLKTKISESNFLELENLQLKKLLEDQVESKSNFLSARVMLDKQSPYLKSFIINVGSNKNLKNGMAVMDGSNFIGRIVDVNYFSSRVLLISDFNSKIPVLIEPLAHHAILSGHGAIEPTLEYLPKNHNIKDGNKVYTSGKGGIFSPGLAIGETKIDEGTIKVLLFSDLSQITFVNVNVGDLDSK